MCDPQTVDWRQPLELSGLGYVRWPDSDVHDSKSVLRAITGWVALIQRQLSCNAAWPYDADVLLVVWSFTSLHGFVVRTCCLLTGPPLAVGHVAEVLG